METTKRLVMSFLTSEDKKVSLTVDTQEMILMKQK